MTLGSNIKKYRKELGLTQAELAKRISDFQADIHRWEADKIAPSIESLKKLAKALHVSVDSLLFSEKEKKYLKVGDKELLDRIKDIEKLSPEDRQAVVRLIDAFKVKADK